MSKKNTFRLTPLSITVSVVFGNLVVTFYAKPSGGNHM